MASPQIENGYTKIANELLEAMCRLYLSGNQWKVLHAIIRKTYGWNKKTDWITATQIAEMTGMHAPHVSSALRVLAERTVILRAGRLIAVQKDYEQWQMDSACNHPKVTRTSNKKKLQEPVRKRTRTSNKTVQEPVRTKDKRHSTKERVNGKSEAVRIFRGVMHQYPNATQQKAIDSKVSKLSLWEHCLKAWAMKGYNPRNVEGVLDWYKKGGPPANRHQEGTAIDYDNWKENPTT